MSWLTYDWPMLAPSAGVIAAAKASAANVASVSPVKCTVLRCSAHGPDAPTVVYAGKDDPIRDSAKPRSPRASPSRRYSSLTQLSAVTPGVLTVLSSQQ